MTVEMSCGHVTRLLRSRDATHGSTAPGELVLLFLHMHAAVDRGSLRWQPSKHERISGTASPPWSATYLGCDLEGAVPYAGNDPLLAAQGS